MLRSGFIIEMTIPKAKTIGVKKPPIQEVFLFQFYLQTFT